MNIVLTGSVAYDYLMTFPGYFRDHILPDHLDSISLSFLVNSMVRLRGGVAPNIAYTLALLGEHPHLFATVGEDFEEYRAWLESLGVDTQGARHPRRVHGFFFRQYRPFQHPNLELLPGRYGLRRAAFHAGYAGLES